MKKLGLWLVFTLAGIVFPIQAWGGHEIKYRISPLGNLVYQLDCMAQVARFQCSRGDYKHLWQSAIEAAENDVKMLQKWRELRAQLDESIEFGGGEDIPMVTTANYPMNAANKLNVLQQSRIMAFAAGSLDEYQQHIELLLSPAHVQAEIQVLAYFWPRFEPWFEQQRTGLAQFVTDAEQLTAELNINQLLTAMRVFYHSDLPEDLVLPVYLIAHPLAQAKTSALAFGQYSLIEVLQGERAADRVAVVIHEIAHFYHESAPLKHHLESMNFFTGADSETGKVGYYLFNEAMATAIGNGLLEQRIKDEAYFDKYLAYPLSFYNDPAIDASAKAAMTLVKQQIESNQRIDAEFLEALDEIWAVALKDLKDNPKQRLRHVGMVNLSSHGNVLIDQLFNLIQPSSAQVIDSESTDAAALTSEDFLINRYPELDVLILADTWQQLAPLKLPGLDVNQPNKQGFQILKNQHGGIRVLLVGDSTDLMVDAVADLLKQASF